VKVQSPSPERAEVEIESVKKVSRPPSRDPISATTEISKSDVRKELEENLNKKPGVGLSLEEFNKILSMDTLPDVSLGEFLVCFVFPLSFRYGWNLDVRVPIGSGAPVI